MHTLSIIIQAPDGGQEILAEVEELLKNRSYSVCSKTEQPSVTCVISLKNESAEINQENNASTNIASEPPIEQPEVVATPALAAEVTPDAKTTCVLPYLNTQSSIQCSINRNQRNNILFVGNLYSVGNDNCFFTYCNSFHKYPIARLDSITPIIKCLVVLENGNRHECELHVMQKDASESERLVLGLEAANALGL